MGRAIAQHSWHEEWGILLNFRAVALAIALGVSTLFSAPGARAAVTAVPLLIRVVV